MSEIGVRESVEALISESSAEVVGVAQRRKFPGSYKRRILDEVDRANLSSTPALIIAGIGFKLTLTPFHMWAADVYEGAPTAVTAYLSVASKSAGLAFMFQFFFWSLW